MVSRPPLDEIEAKANQLATEWDYWPYWRAGEVLPLVAYARHLEARLARLEGALAVIEANWTGAGAVARAALGEGE